MFAELRNPMLPSIAAMLAAVGSAGVANADWVTIKNTTNRVIVVQNGVAVNGQMRRGKPIRLLPGEASREFLAPPVVALEVYDAQMPNKPVLTTNLAIKTENQAFSVATTPTGVVVTPVPVK